MTGLTPIAVTRYEDVVGGIITVVLMKPLQDYKIGPDLAWSCSFKITRNESEILKEGRISQADSFWALLTALETIRRALHEIEPELIHKWCDFNIPRPVKNLSNKDFYSSVWEMVDAEVTQEIRRQSKLEVPPCRTIMKYKCGLKAGDMVTVVKPIQRMHLDGVTAGYLINVGEELKVKIGSNLYPHQVSLYGESIGALELRDDDSIFEYLQVVEKSDSADQ